MKVTIEVPTNEMRRLLDLTSGDSNLRHVPFEQFVAEACKRGITAWEQPSGLALGHPESDPLANLVETCRMLAKSWAARGYDPNQRPDFFHVVNALRRLDG